MLGLIFTYAATLFGSLAGLFNPFMGLLVYISFSIIKPASMWSWSVAPEPYSRMIAIAMLLGWAFKGFGRWEFGKGWGIVLAFIAFWSWAALSGLMAPNHEVAWEFLESKGKILLPFLVGITLVNSVPKLKQLAWVIMISLGYVAYELNVSYYSGFNRVQLIGFGGMDNNSVAIAMVAGVGLAFFLGIAATKWWHRLGAWLAAILMAHTVMFSFSRGGMLALVISVLVSSFLLPPKKPKHLLAFGLFLIIGFRLAGPEVVDRFWTIFEAPQDRDVSAQSRLDLWPDMWDTMLKNPIVGVGPDHWPLTAPQYGWPLGKEGHNVWLQTGAELGFPGLIFLGTFYGLCMIRLWPLVRNKIDEDIDPWLPHVGRMVIAALTGFIISAQFVTLEGLEIPYYLVLIGAGALKLIAKPAPAPLMARMPAMSAASGLFLRTR